MEIVTRQHSDYASVNETYTYSYDHADRLMNTTQGCQVVEIDDQVEDPTYKGVFNFMDGANEEIEYEYDKKGNLVKDLNKNISKIEYNLLNLPSKITFGDGKTITYVYDASGVKLLANYKTAVPASNHTIAYCGNMIYEDDTFKQVLFDGGYITFTDNRAMYHYYLKDHLGNNRVVVSSKGEVEQVNHYHVREYQRRHVLIFLRMFYLETVLVLRNWKMGTFRSIFWDKIYILMDFLIKSLGVITMRRCLLIRILYL